MKTSVTGFDVVGGVSIIGTAIVLSKMSANLLRKVAADLETVTNTFLTAADLAATTTMQSPGLLVQLRLVQSKGRSTIAYLRTLGQTDAAIQPLLADVDVVIASSQDTYNSIIAQKPPLISFTVPATMALFVIYFKRVMKELANGILMTQKSLTYLQWKIFTFRLVTDKKRMYSLHNNS